MRDTDPEGNATVYRYDTRGRPAAIIDGNGNEIVSDFDTTGTAGCSVIDRPVGIAYPTFARCPPG